MRWKQWNSLNSLLMLVGITALILGSVCWGYDYWQKERFISYWLNKLPSEEHYTSISPSPSPVFQVKETTPSPGPTPRPVISPQVTIKADTITPTPASSPTPFPSPTRMPPPTHIAIPKIGVDAPVVEVGWKIVKTENGVEIQWETAEYAAGHHFNSANPGEGGNVVISGHHNIKGKVFNRLWELEPGDEIQLQNSKGEMFIYTVEKVLLLKEKGASDEERRAHARYMDPKPEETLTLISCWPPWGNAYRVVIIAKPAKLWRSPINPPEGSSLENPTLY